MPFTDEDKALVVAFSDWLATKKDFDPTSLEIVQQTMAEAVGLDLHVPSTASIRPFSLLDVFNAGRQALEKQRAEFESKVMPKLVESNFFASAQAGTAEHDALLAHARMKFFARESSGKSAAAPAAAPAEATPAAAAPSPVDFARAEVHKTEGNQHLSAGRHQQAVESYSKAIQINSQNNVRVVVYFPVSLYLVNVLILNVVSADLLC
jgi:tetratricopeptide (TPR) repeat protein